MRILSLLLLLVAPLAADEKSEQIFVRRVAPLFHEKCLACHGKDESQLKGRFDMRTLASTLKGGESEQSALVVGKPEESPLYLAVTRKHDDWQPMPPKEADKLSAEQVAWIKDWIAGGAPWPDESRAKEIARANTEKWSVEDGITVSTSGGLSPEWTDRKYKTEGLWAYQPVKRQTPSGSQGHPIDMFIAAKMPTEIQVAPSADRVTLIRRATFDLTGLPPTPEEVEDFVKDSRSDAEAFTKVVERLLESPHYGERMVVQSDASAHYELGSVSSRYATSRPKVARRQRPVRD